MSMGVAVAAAWAVGSGLSAAGALPSPWPATPAPVLFELCLLGAGGVLSAGAALGGRMGWWGAWGAGWLVWALVGLTLAVLVPEVSFLFLSPVLVAGGAALIGSPRPALEPGVWRDLVACAPLTVAVMLWLPLGGLLYQAVGLSWHGIFAGLAALLVNLCLPWLTQGLRSRALAVALGSALLVGFIVALVVPPYSSTHPKLLRFVYVTDAGTREARLFAEVVGKALPGSVQQAGGFGAAPVETQPWAPIRFTAFESRAAAEAAELQFVILERASTQEGTRVRARLSSPRRAGTLRLAFPPEVGGQVVQIDDKPVIPMSERRLRFTKGWHVLDLVAIPSEGVVVDLKFAAGATPAAYVLDRSPGLPEAYAPVAASRGAEAVSFGDGDETVVVHQVRF
jgi:hypothetical protein